jgi:tRNA (guanine-N7-)-methyltransferase
MRSASLRKRVRQHVNPLSAKYGTPLTPPDWATVFANPTQPLHLDIGSARGRFVLGMAEHYPDWNFLGLEIREPLVEAALRQAQDLTNAHFLFGNANNSLAQVLKSLPAGVLQGASIQFPDPWFKKRHQKRRVVQPSLVQALADGLQEGGYVVLQSDIESVAVEMCDRVVAHPGFVRTAADWLPDSPFPVQTEREWVTLSQGKPVYRARFLRRQIPPP